MARRRIVEENVLNLDDFLCAVCCEIFNDPYELPCSHIFCKSCIEQATSTSNGAACPYCRQPYSPSQKIQAIQTRNDIKRGLARCKHCNEKLPLRHMRHHIDDCIDKELTKSLDKAFATIAEDRSSRAIAESLPGLNAMASGSSRTENGRLRSVPSFFDCPCCNVKRLDRQSLLEHVSVQHKGMNFQVVCPICAVMPWGDKNYKSSNFFDHIRIRHQFDYEYFVEMNKDEDIVLRDVLKASMFDG